MSKYYSLWVLLFSFNLVAVEWSSQVAVVSDYLFNGVSQTKEDAALQVGLDYQNDQSFYFGSWASNVDYVNADMEIDIYYGKSFQLANQSNLTVGLAHYSYFGRSDSHSNNYSELVISWQWNQLTSSLWFSNDYFGTGADHYIVSIVKDWQINEEIAFTLGVDKSTSLDENKYQWLEGQNDYWHAFAKYSYQWQSIIFSLSYHDTNRDKLAQPTLLFTIEKGFSW